MEKFVRPSGCHVPPTSTLTTSFCTPHLCHNGGQHTGALKLPRAEAGCHAQAPARSSSITVSSYGCCETVRVWSFDRRGSQASTQYAPLRRSWFRLHSKVHIRNTIPMFACVIRGFKINAETWSPANNIAWWWNDINW